MNNAYIVAHKVHGQLTFDIAERLHDGKFGTASDPAPWWITSTGHRVYPFWVVPVDDIRLYIGSADGKAEYEDIWTICPDMPENHRDFYIVTKHQPKAKISFEELDLSDLGL